MTWGWYQITLGLLLTWFLFMYQCRMKSLPALILTVTSYWAAFVVYTLFVVLILGRFISTDQIPVRLIANHYVVSTGLALIFSSIQSVFFLMLNRWYNKSIKHIVGVIFSGNIAAALITTYIMRASFATI